MSVTKVEKKKCSDRIFPSESANKNQDTTKSMGAGEKTKEIPTWASRHSFRSSLGVFGLGSRSKLQEVGDDRHPRGQ